MRNKSVYECTIERNFIHGLSCFREKQHNKIILYSPAQNNIHKSAECRIAVTHTIVTQFKHWVFISLLWNTEYKKGGFCSHLFPCILCIWCILLILYSSKLGDTNDTIRYLFCLHASSVSNCGCMCDFLKCISMIFNTFRVLMYYVCVHKYPFYPYKLMHTVVRIFNLKSFSSVTVQFMYFGSLCFQYYLQQML